MKGVQIDLAPHPPQENLPSKVQPYQGYETIVIDIFPNISRSKGNQTMKFGRLIEYNMRKIFLEKLYTECGVETSPGTFLKNKNLAYLWIKSLKFYAVCFYCMPS